MAYRCVQGYGECNGCMKCNPDPHYYCPVCGEEDYEPVFGANDGTRLGCDNCAQRKDPHEVLENETNE